ncbi:MAG: glycosyltransferase family 2 protein [Chloroflexota bacterium]
MTALGANQKPMISVVMPCLNEEASVGLCIQKAYEALTSSGWSGEVIIVDNGSTDHSVEIAKNCGAQVIHEHVRGYGKACLTGLRAANGEILLMGDADMSYDFGEIPKLIEPLQHGYQMVLGTRFRGGMKPGAMPLHNQYLGNPVLTLMLNGLFGMRVSDAHTGMRAFTADAFHKMGLRATGMEFASEMLIKAKRADLKLCEIPISYHPREGTSKLRPLADAWRHIHFMLLYSSTSLFLAPGLTMLLLGLLILIVLAFGPIRIGGAMLDFHYMFVGSLVALAGNQLLLLGIMARTYADAAQFEPADELIQKFLELFTLGRGILLGTGITALGLLIFLRIFIVWVLSNFQALDEVRGGIMGLTLTILGMQYIFASLLLSFTLLPHVTEPE